MSDLTNLDGGSTVAGCCTTGSCGHADGAGEMARLRVDLAAERALADQLHHAMCVSAVRLSYPEVFDALAAYREARRER